MKVSSAAVISNHLRDLPDPREAGWSEIERVSDGSSYVRRWRGQRWVMIRSVARELDGQLWCHVSASRPDRCPTWEEVAEVKRDAIGPSLAALQVMPRESDHVNIHPNCLHLFAPLEDWPLPDFTRGTRSI